ncbi:MAG TPA: helix-turn-helix domain-containing protein [Candidatus Saccharimonadia bacterium]|nr:helix-turn-helix domain-containing protein [Candidatus Saccharimonadia bacterium]
MTNFNVLLRQEVSRIARRETRAQTRQMKSASATYRRAIAALKRQVVGQAREIAALKRASARAAPAAAADASEGPVRYRAGGVAAHRKRLGLSAESFGRLVGVTGQTIYNWERGKRPRLAQLRALSAVRALGRRDAAARLEQLAKPAGRGRKSKKAAAGRPARRRSR